MADEEAERIRQATLKKRREVRKANPQTINGTTLTEEHVGAEVFYVPQRLRLYGAVHDPWHPRVERGVITHWNSRYVFVRYNVYPHGIATSAEDLFL